MVWYYKEFAFSLFSCLAMEGIADCLNLSVYAKGTSKRCSCLVLPCFLFRGNMWDTVSKVHQGQTYPMTP